MKTGVLASQGAFAEHIAVLEKLGVEAIPVRLPRQLAGLDGLIIPGGESTTISKLMKDYKLVSAIKKLADEGKPIFGTCAGMILLAKEIPDSKVEPLSLMDISVRRNAFGRQNESFETDLNIPVLGEKPFHAVFIRAPLIESVNGTTEVLARLDDGTAVAARQGQFLVSAFHPELTEDLRFHRYFLDMISGEK
ncbi:MAG: pyridoxal 5'-phosphate synthase glutaminase subunit PdxT [Dehalococcoidales bacterium]|nr:MAG: pyridoxal 5'-phosphate synthase glutaminase subunit PdxT [Dehalococcoidales bacterium]